MRTSGDSRRILRLAMLGAILAGAARAQTITEYPFLHRELPRQHHRRSGRESVVHEGPRRHHRPDHADGVVTAFPVPTPDFVPVIIVAGPDGNLWFTEQAEHAHRGQDRANHHRRRDHRVPVLLVTDIPSASRRARTATCGSPISSARSPGSRPPASSRSFRRPASSMPATASSPARTAISGSLARYRTPSVASRRPASSPRSPSRRPPRGQAPSRRARTAISGSPKTSEASAASRRRASSPSSPSRPPTTSPTASPPARTVTSGLRRTAMDLSGGDGRRIGKITPTRAK